MGSEAGGFEEKGRGVVQKKSWFRHTRVLVGVVLVAGSAAAGWFLLSEAQRSEPYVVIAADIAKGQPVTAEVVDEVLLGGGADGIGLVRPAELTQFAEYVAVTDLVAGDVLRRSDLQRPLPTDSSRFSVEVDTGGADWLSRGTLVEVWVSPLTADQQFSVPYVAAPFARIVDVRADEGFAANPALVRVDLEVGRRDLPELVHARANGFDIQLSPVAGGP